MHDTAARLVDGVLPRVPVRQWVLSLPRWALSRGHGKILPGPQSHDEVTERRLSVLRSVDATWKCPLSAK
jgi:hypothetical protein